MRYAALLRGINLGRRRVTGEQLCAPLRDAGLEEVASFLASGNVTFAAEGDAEEDELRSRIEAVLERDLGFEVTTFLRSEDELAAIVDRQPFTGEALAASTGKPQVVLLQRPPTSEEADAVGALATAGDVLVPTGREVHWLPPAGLSTSTLDLTALERLVGPTTIRTANTLARLHARIA